MLRDEQKTLCNIRSRISFYTIFAIKTVWNSFAVERNVLSRATKLNRKWKCGTMWVVHTRNVNIIPSLGYCIGFYCHTILIAFYELRTTERDWDVGRCSLHRVEYELMCFTNENDLSCPLQLNELNARNNMPFYHSEFLNCFLLLRTPSNIIRCSIGLPNIFEFPRTRSQPVLNRFGGNGRGSHPETKCSKVWSFLRVQLIYNDHSV